MFKFTSDITFKLLDRFLSVSYRALHPLPHPLPPIKKEKERRKKEKEESILIFYYSENSNLLPLNECLFSSRIL